MIDRATQVGPFFSLELLLQLQTGLLNFLHFVRPPRIESIYGVRRNLMVHNSTWTCFREESSRQGTGGVCHRRRCTECSRELRSKVQKHLFEVAGIRNDTASCCMTALRTVGEMRGKGQVDLYGLPIIPLDLLSLCVETFFVADMSTCTVLCIESITGGRVSCRMSCVFLSIDL